MLYTVSNSVVSIKQLLSDLQITYPNYAFISYIDGEFGIRVWMYNSYVYSFISKVKKTNVDVIGICFIGQKCFIEHLCDHVIEIQDTCFDDTIANIIDHSQNSENHKNIYYVPNTKYVGNDGWDLSYIRGLHNPLYEQMINEFNFSNIFYTLHCDGSRFINTQNAEMAGSPFIMFKYNNLNITLNTDTATRTSLYSLPVKIIKQKNDNIVLWIRNTTKHPGRNMEAEVYLNIFKFCIEKQKYVYVFQDLNKINIQNSEYIIDCDYRKNNIPLFDKFKEICNKSSLYIGTDSGPLYVAQTSCNIYTVCIGACGSWEYPRKCNNNSFVSPSNIYNFLIQFYNM